MDLPTVPKLEEVASISPSFYNTAVTCKAKAAWSRFAPWGTFPGTTGAILGGCFHAVMEVANQGKLPAGPDGVAKAKEVFDVTARDLFSKAHPLLRAKFRVATGVPYYFLRRARAVEMAIRSRSRVGTRPERSEYREETSVVRAGRFHVEMKLKSRDGLVNGQIDLLDEAERRITDYKSGHAPADGAGALSENEVRQLRLYAYLARENGYEVATATIVRGDGNEAEVNISADDVVHEAEAARALRIEFNLAAERGANLAELATPRRENCGGCPCLSACEPFWRAAEPDWEEACGTNAEGVVTAIHSATVSGMELVTLTIDSPRGSAPRGGLVVEQIPVQWLSILGQPPSLGDTMRIVQASRFTPTPEKEVRELRVDRFKSTTVWRAVSTSQLTGNADPSLPG